MFVLTKTMVLALLIWAMSTSSSFAQLAIVSPAYFVVDAGGSINVDAFGSVNPDCSVNQGATARLVEAPRGGDVSIGRESTFPNFRSDNVRAACSKRRLQLTSIRYRSSPDFVGTDQFVVEEQAPSGVARMIRFFVHVRAASGVAAAARPMPGGQAGRATCSGESSLASLDSTRPARIAFTNRSLQQRDVFWIDYRGSRVKYRTLGPGERLNQSTYLTHPWVIADDRGNCLKVVLPTSTASSITIR